MRFPIWSLCFATLALVASGRAQATPVSFTASFSDTSPVGNNKVMFAGVFSTPVATFTTPTYSDILRVGALDANLTDTTQFDSVAVTFDFSEPGPGIVTVGGVGSLTDTFHLVGHYYSEVGTVLWKSNTETIAFADGEDVTIKIPNLLLFGKNGVAGGTADVTFSVPEPASLVLLGTGLLGLAGIRQRRNRL